MGTILGPENFLFVAHPKLGLCFLEYTTQIILFLQGILVSKDASTTF